jgi:hypothetical protein
MHLSFLRAITPRHMSEVTASARYVLASPAREPQSPTCLVVSGKALRAQRIGGESMPLAGDIVAGFASFVPKPNGSMQIVSCAARSVPAIFKRRHGAAKNTSHQLIFHLSAASDAGLLANSVAQRNARCAGGGITNTRAAPRCRGPGTKAAGLASACPIQARSRRSASLQERHALRLDRPARIQRPVGPNPIPCLRNTGNRLPGRIRGTLASLNI